MEFHGYDFNISWERLYVRKSPRCNSNLFCVSSALYLLTCVQHSLPFEFWAHSCVGLSQLLSHGRACFIKCLSESTSAPSPPTSTSDVHIYMVLSISRSRWMNPRNVIFLLEGSVEFSVAYHNQTWQQSNIYSGVHILAWDPLGGCLLLGSLWDCHGATGMEMPSWGWDVEGGFTHSWGLSWNEWDSAGLIRHFSLHVVWTAGYLEQFPQWLRTLREQKGKLSGLSA